ncbi:MAG: hypothetical protein ACT4QB_05430 [Gammaproteobacteria bacterium]
MREALQRWTFPGIEPAPALLVSRCVRVEDLPGPTSPETRYVIAFDGSPQEVPARVEYPSIRVEYLQLAGVYVDLARFFGATDGPFIDPRKLASSSQQQIINAVLPGSNVYGPSLTPTENWRSELFELFRRQGISDFGEPPFTVLDALFHLYGSPAGPIREIVLGRCPYKDDGCLAANVPVGPSGTGCPSCGRQVWPTDVLRTHEEFDDEGSNVIPVTRTMSVIERLLSISYLACFLRAMPQVLADGAFITDGPLAVFGTSAPMKRKFVSFWSSLVSAVAAQGIAPPLVFGLEKSGIFVDHAKAIGSAVENGRVVVLDEAYIRRHVKRRKSGTPYGQDEFYGRRFFFKTSSGRMLVLTVPRSPGGQPYGEGDCEELAEYPTLKRTVQLLDRIETRLYTDAVIPVALAHSAAALPLGTGQDVLRLLAQDVLGLSRTGRPASPPHYP